jgi:hypothetical protein
MQVLHPFRAGTGPFTLFYKDTTKNACFQFFSKEKQSRSLSLRPAEKERQRRAQSKARRCLL